MGECLAAARALPATLILHPSMCPTALETAPLLHFEAVAVVVLAVALAAGARAVVALVVSMVVLK